MGEQCSGVGTYWTWRPRPFALQVWSEQDFEFLRQKLLPTYPAAHYFRR